MTSTESMLPFEFRSCASRTTNRRRGVSKFKDCNGTSNSESHLRSIEVKRKKSNRVLSI